MEITKNFGTTQKVSQVKYSLETIIQAWVLFPVEVAKCDSLSFGQGLKARTFWMVIASLKIFSHFRFDDFPKVGCAPCYCRVRKLEKRLRALVSASE